MAPGFLVSTAVRASVGFFLQCHVVTLGLQDQDSIAAINPVSALSGSKPAGCDAVLVLYWVTHNGVVDGGAIACAGRIVLEYLVEEPGIEALIDQARLDVGHLHIMRAKEFRVGGSVQFQICQGGVVGFLEVDDAPHSCVAVEGRSVIHSSILTRQPIHDGAGLANQEPAA